MTREVHRKNLYGAKTGIVTNDNDPSVKKYKKVMNLSASQFLSEMNIFETEIQQNQIELNRKA